MLVDALRVAQSASRITDDVRGMAQAVRSRLAGRVDRSGTAERPAFLRRVRNLMAGDARPSRLDLERILGGNDLLDVNYLERGLSAARAVGRITLYDGDRISGYATGFLVGPGLLLTNHHVFDQAATAAGAVVEFGYELDTHGRPKIGSRFTLDPAAFFCNDVDLDFALTAVGASDGHDVPLTSFGWLRMIPTTGKVLEGEWMTIIQHPSGEPKQIAARENQLLKLTDRTLWYATDTAPGSSGAPVFNDAWQVVALHHSGVPDTDAQGNWLGPDGQPAPHNPSENQVKWIANEGIRVSRIVAAVEANAPPGKGREDFLAAARGELETPERGAPDVLAPEAPPSAQSANRSTPDDVLLTQADGVLSLTMPFRALRTLRIGTSAGASAMLGVPDGEADEKFVLDPDYASRDGYRPDFLSVHVPLPALTPAALAKAVRMPGGGNELKYHHFSIVLSSERRLLFFSAENSDRDLLGQQSRKALSDGAADRWIFDKRIDRKFQVGDDFYGGSGFDRGHVVRREDNYWGDNKAMATFANFDTFHFTNCTPQHPAYNRSAQHGLWGELENYLADESGAKKPRLSLFAGPVFSKSDIRREGVQVPKQFWKVVVADRDAGGLAAFAFLLSQAKLVRDMEEDIVAGPFRTYQVPLARLEKLTEVRFPEVLHRADTYAKALGGDDEKMEVRYLEAVRFPQVATETTPPAAG